MVRLLYPVCWEANSHQSASRAAACFMGTFKICQLVCFPLSKMPTVQCALLIRRRMMCLVHAD